MLFCRGKRFLKILFLFVAIFMSSADLYSIRSLFGGNKGIDPDILKSITDEELDRLKKEDFDTWSKYGKAYYNFLYSKLVTLKRHGQTGEDRRKAGGLQATLDLLYHHEMYTPTKTVKGRAMGFIFSSGGESVRPFSECVVYLAKSIYIDPSDIDTIYKNLDDFLYKWRELVTQKDDEGLLTGWLVDRIRIENFVDVFKSMVDQDCFAQSFFSSKGSFEINGSEGLLRPHARKMRKEDTNEYIRGKAKKWGKIALLAAAGVGVTAVAAGIGALLFKKFVYDKGYLGKLKTLCGCVGTAEKIFNNMKESLNKDGAENTTKNLVGGGLNAVGEMSDEELKGAGRNGGKLAGELYNEFGKHRKKRRRRDIRGDDHDDSTKKTVEDMAEGGVSGGMRGIVDNCYTENGHGEKELNDVPGKLGEVLAHGVNGYNAAIGGDGRGLERKSKQIATGGIRAGAKYLFKEDEETGEMKNLKKVAKAAATLKNEYDEVTSDLGGGEGEHALTHVGKGVGDAAGDFIKDTLGFDEEDPEKRVVVQEKNIGTLVDAGYTFLEKVKENKKRRAARVREQNEGEEVIEIEDATENSDEKDIVYKFLRPVVDSVCENFKDCLLPQDSENLSPDQRRKTLANNGVNLFKEILRDEWVKGLVGEYSDMIVGKHKKAIKKEILNKVRKKSMVARLFLGGVNKKNNKKDRSSSRSSSRSSGRGRSRSRFSDDFIRLNKKLPPSPSSMRGNGSSPVRNNNDKKE